MKKTDINWDGSKIRIRPSSVNTFVNCPFQWAKVFLEGKRTIPGARAAIGTAIHKGVEEGWKEAKILQKADFNLSMVTDAAIDEFAKLDEEDELMYDDGEDLNTANHVIKTGLEAFSDDIVPFTDIPDKVEHEIVMPIAHDVVDELGGTIDYLHNNTIADVKTSKRKPTTANHVLQQTIYKILAEYEGYNIKSNLIQAVALTKKPSGYILQLDTDENKTRFILNSLLDTLKAFNDGVDPAVLFRGNPSYYLCSPKYCTLYKSECPYVNGE